VSEHDGDDYWRRVPVTLFVVVGTAPMHRLHGGWLQTGAEREQNSGDGHWPDVAPFPIRLRERDRASGHQLAWAATSATPDVPAKVLVPEYLTRKEAALLLGCSVKGLEGMRKKGTGPRFVQIGGCIRYRRSDLV
jgi:hypothetical protein